MNIENAKNTLKEFIIAMNHWELHCHSIMINNLLGEFRSQIVNELNIIFDKFCTKKNGNMVGKLHCRVEIHQNIHQMKR